MTVSIKTGLPFSRGAKPSPRHKLLSAAAFAPVAAPPAEFAIVPPKLSYWDNERDGVCVSSEEAFAKACWSVFCGLPELFASEAEVRSFAARHGWLNGATLTEVMDEMVSGGMSIGGTTYRDGAYSGVDYSDELVLKAAISSGPVKIAIDADALPRGAGNGSGWHAFGKGRYPNTDHCVGIPGYGTAAFCFGKLGVPVPAGVDPQKPDCYLLFTWNSIGVVDHQWLMGTCTEAWVRKPTTVGQSPAPVPPPPPPPPPPIPPSWWQQFLEWLFQLLGGQHPKGAIPVQAILQLIWADVVANKGVRDIVADVIAYLLSNPQQMAAVAGAIDWGKVLKIVEAIAQIVIPLLVK